VLQVRISTENGREATQWVVYCDGRLLDNCLWADDETGEAECMFYVERRLMLGKWVAVALVDEGRVQTYMVHGRIVFRPIADLFRSDLTDEWL
jgi:hypothetical protein